MPHDHSAKAGESLEKYKIIKSFSDSNLFEHLPHYVQRLVFRSN